MGGYYRRRIKEAACELRKIIINNPNHFFAHYLLGIILAKSGKIDEAINLLKIAIEINPDFVQARINLSILYARKKRKNLALSELSVVEKNARKKNKAEVLVKIEKIKMCL